MKHIRPLLVCAMGAGLLGCDGGKAPGPVRDRIAECQQEWMNTLERAAQDARAQRQLPAGSDPQQLAFELEGALLTANWYFHLYADPGYLGRNHHYLDAAWAQYLHRKGPVESFLRRNVSAAQDRRHPS